MTDARVAETVFAEGGVAALAAVLVSVVNAREEAAQALTGMARHKTNSSNGATAEEEGPYASAVRDASVVAILKSMVGTGSRAAAECLRALRIDV